MEPFLPPMAPDPTTPQAKKSTSRRTLALWLVLIVFFVAIYRLSLPDSHQLRAERPATPPCEQHMDLYSWTPMFAAVALVFAAFMLIRRQTRRTHAYFRDQEPATLALTQQRWPEAAALFAPLIEKYKGHGGALVASHERAIARLHTGDLAGAINDAIESEKGQGMFARAVRVRGAVLLAELYALDGDTAAATSWAADARVRLQSSNERIAVGAVLRIAETILLCREEKFAEAIAGLDRDQAILDTIVSLSRASDAWLFRAFAQTQLESARSVGSVAPLLTLLRTRPRGSFDYLAVKWPALRDFLVAHELAA